MASYLTGYLVSLRLAALTGMLMVHGKAKESDRGCGYAASFKMIYQIVGQ
jgi:hypothetical protein